MTDPHAAEKLADEASDLIIDIDAPNTERVDYIARAAATIRSLLQENATLLWRTSGVDYLERVVKVEWERDAALAQVAELKALVAETNSMHDEYADYRTESIQKIAERDRTIEQLRANEERLILAYIEASNPGIDMDQVRRERAERKASVSDAKGGQ